jgi:hypothetical protein
MAADSPVTRADTGIEQLLHHVARCGCRQKPVNDDRISIDLRCLAEYVCGRFSLLYESYVREGLVIG